MVQNNLPPASQQWARDLEKRISDLERANNTTTEFQRNSSAIFGGLSATVAAVQQQQQKALETAQVYAFDLSVTGTTTSNPLSNEFIISAPSWAVRGTIVSLAFSQRTATGLNSSYPFSTEFAIFADAGTFTSVSGSTTVQVVGHGWATYGKNGQYVTVTGAGTSYNVTSSRTINLRGAISSEDYVGTVTGTAEIAIIWS